MSNVAHTLNNPAWQALWGDHARFALGGDLARRYPADMSPLAALRVPTAEALAALATFVTPGERIGLLGSIPARHPQWQIERRLQLVQMVCNSIFAGGEAYPVLELNIEDATNMLALARLTEPGPFLVQTVKMGTYVGVWQGDELVAMAGERLLLQDYGEISAVCTHPEHRGRGYASALVSHLVKRLFARYKTPFLHVMKHNGRAVALYRQLGFCVRRELALTVLRRE